MDSSRLAGTVGIVQFPFASFEVSLSFIPGRESLPSLITFLNEYGETLLKLGTITLLMMRSAEPEVVLVGEEISQD